MGHPPSLPITRHVHPSTLLPFSSHAAAVSLHAILHLPNSTHTQHTQHTQHTHTTLPRVWTMLV
ncbi:hypothetical protein B0O80DRAFT_449746 [Mortierella sp. GBAus27b]|nr:hypothetical protein B0O80DRAFT_449746 [Mortierella sp. GBAus27b]